MNLDRRTLRDRLRSRRTRRPPVGDASLEPYLVPLMSPRQRLIFYGLMALWLAALAQFWWWWLQPEHNVGIFRYIANSLLAFWTTAIPGYFFAVFALSKVPNPSVDPPSGLRVAMVVTKAPSEPVAVVQRTLLAMLAQRYPHDTWLADEDPAPGMLDWCAQHGVKVSTRRGVAEYHRPDWPRRTKCKEGNLAYFYDTYGYENYEIVAQLDADHVPADGYLEEMLRPFADPEVGYVSAPSICDANAASSWSARGRLFLEAMLHGPLQAGYTGGLAPLCIGSHYAVRTAALREVGGLGPELAEDHSTTLLMNAGGWRGVHALNAIAHGDGPATFADMATQEFQWSRSLMTILLRHTRHYIGRLPFRLKLEFVFAQLWYSLFCIAMASTIFLPTFALLTGQAWVRVSYVEFFVRIFLVTLAIFLIYLSIRRSGWFRPHPKLFSWEVVLFVFARWPWNLWGIIVAVIDWVRGRTSDFKVTPKGVDAVREIPFRVVGVYLGISIVSGSTATLISDAGTAIGFYAFSFFNAALYLALALAVIVLHQAERGPPSPKGERGKGGWTPALVASVTIAAVFLVGATMRLPAGIDGILWGSGLNLRQYPPLREMVGDKGVPFGVFDPNKAFSDADYIAIEHHFISWLEADYPKRLQSLATYSSDRNRWPMVTIEPWSDGREGPLSLLQGINAGYYDREIQRTCETLADMGMPVFVRWGHEMEVPTGRYPWADDDSDAYIAAYRRFVDACRTEGKEFYYVWSPRGDGPHYKYYPGAAYLDVVGLSIYSYSVADLDWFGRVRSFEESLAERYEDARVYGKPIMIAELGVEGGAEWQHQWLAKGLSKMDQFPQVESIVYFNAVDHREAWDPKWPVPDWSIDPRVFTTEVK